MPAKSKKFEAKSKESRSSS